MERGDKVYYLDPQGKRRRALVLEVHLDNAPHYYTLRLLRTGREVQTELSRLRSRRSERIGGGQK